MSTRQRAAEILREYAAMIEDGETVRAIGHPMRGKIEDPEIQAEVDEYRALAADLIASSESKRISVKALVQMLEGQAPNTDTCWQWRTATALREMAQWETAEIEL